MTLFDWWRESGATEFDGATTTMSMPPLPYDLATPPNLSFRWRGWARRFLRYARDVRHRALRPEYRATQEPPMLNREWGYGQLMASPLRATHIASATYKGLRGFERWVR